MIGVNLERCLSYFGPPGKIISDGGREFQNEDLIKFMER